MVNDDSPDAKEAAELGEGHIDWVADRVMTALDTCRSIAPLSEARPAFDLAEGYRVASALAVKRIARGERPVGWKIGFTNRTIWREYGVFAPIWGPIYAATVQEVAAGAVAECPLYSFVEPRLEPEIAFRFAVAPRPGMSEAALLACIDAVAHGFEVVQSIFPGWRFTAADTVAAGALHGAYYHGPWTEIEQQDRAAWLSRLSSFEIALSCNGELIDRGHAANVLDGPLSALRHFVDGIAEQPALRGVEAGDIVTTGTVTRAFAVAPGETWSTQLSGLPLPGLAIAFR